MCLRNEDHSVLMYLMRRVLFLPQMPAMHADAITDLKVKAGGVNAEQILLSSSRDGVVNVWC